MNTRICAVENKTPSVSGLVKKTNYDAKTKDIDGKYFTTADCNNFASDILDVKIKRKELFNKTDIDKKLRKINKKITKHAEAGKKVAWISEERYDFLLGRMYFTGNDGNQSFSSNA